MEISEFVLRTAFLALPGLVGAKLYRKLRGRDRDSKTWQDFTEVLLFALASYVVLAGILALWALCCGPEVPRPAAAESKRLGLPGRMSIIDAVFDSQTRVDVFEVFLASLIGLMLAVGASYVHTKNLAMRFFQRIGVTRRFGDEDVWEFFLCSPNTDDWLFVRDHKADVVYYGAIAQYSESELERELVIENVSVYSAESKRLYDCKAVYLSRARDALTIELPDFESLRCERSKHTDESSIKEKGFDYEQRNQDGNQSCQ